MTPPSSCENLRRVSTPTLRIADLAIYPPLALAPMSGITDLAFRRMIRRASGASAGLLYTEFISVEALTRHVPRTLEMLRLDPTDHPIAVQIYGRDPDRLVQAAELAVQAGADVVDVNAGCPARKVIRRGGGAALMREPEHLQQIVARLRAVVPGPLTVKIRSGWDYNSVNAVEVAQRVADAGADAVTVHGRTRTQGYAGLADWDLIRRVREALTVPVIGNGDVTTPELALQRMEETGVHGVMIGRGAMGDPWIFAAIGDLLAGRGARRVEVGQRLDWWLGYGVELAATLPAKAVPGRLKSLAGPLTRGLPHGSALRRQIYLQQSQAAIEAVLQAYREQWPRLQRLVERYGRPGEEPTWPEPAGARAQGLAR